MSPSPQPSPSQPPASAPEPGPFDFPTTPPSQVPIPHVKGGPYDFTKRKRWADLVSADAVERVSFIVKPGALTVLYCASAVCDGLGWREVDLVDAELTDYMNESDHGVFRETVEEALATNTEFEITVRMKAKTPGASWTDTEEARVLIRARPFVFQLWVGPTAYDKENYPVLLLSVSQYETRLHSILELEIERAQLELRLMALREEATPEILAEINASRTANEGSSSFYTSSNLAARQSENAAAERKMDGAGPSAGGEASSSTPPKASPPRDEEEEDGVPKKKKAKKAQSSEQHVCVTCGRTDSPEWRKGPLGPKTLCNACGLRWAKLNRKADDTEAVPSVAHDDGSGTGSTPGSSHSSENP